MASVPVNATAVNPDPSCLDILFCADNFSINTVFRMFCL
jgi:hypothetical protein